MAGLADAVLLLQAKNYSGSGNWLDESGNGHDGTINGAKFLSYGNVQYGYFPGTVGNNVEVTLAVATIYDYTVTYLDNSTATGSETSDGGGVLTLGDNQANFTDKSVKTIDVTADGGGATLALFDATDKTGLVEPFATYTDTIPEAWTLNQTASAYVLTVVDRAMFLLDGVDDGITVTSHADLNFAAAESLTLMAVMRRTAASSAFLLEKNWDGPGYYLQSAASGASGLFNIDDGPTASFDVKASVIVANTLAIVSGVRNVADDDIEAFVDGVGSGSPTTDATTGTLSTAQPFEIGSRDAVDQFLHGQIIAAVLWRSALTDAEVVAAGEALLAAGTPSMMLLGM